MRKSPVKELVLPGLALLFSYLALNSWVESQLSVPPNTDQYKHSSSEQRNKFTRYACRFVNLTCDYKATKKDSNNRKITTSEKNQQLNHSTFADLSAQEGMWRAANTLVWLTLGQILMGAGTIYLVFRTFQVQKDELDQTKVANTLQLKPYFKFVEAKLEWYPLIPAFENCAALTLAIQNTGETTALDLSNLVVTHCKITYSIDPHHTGSLFNSVFELPVEVIVQESMQFDPTVDERNIRSYFPKNDISRKVVNPEEIVRYFVPMPIDTVPDYVDTHASNIKCMLWTAAGHFLFRDSLGANESKLRMCKFRAYFGQNAVVTMGDGTIHSTVGSSKTVAGVLEEIYDQQEIQSVIWPQNLT